MLRVFMSMGERKSFRDGGAVTLRRWRCDVVGAAMAMLRYQRSVGGAELALAVR